jgi:hypothetical protein
MEQPRDHVAGRQLDLARSRELPLQDVMQGWRQRELPTLAVLGFARFESQPPIDQIDVGLLTREQLRPDTPSRGIRHLKDGL